MTLQATVTVATDKDRAVATIVTAFSGDPVLRWFFPESHAYLRDFPLVVKTFGADPAFSSDAATCADAFCGVAFWHPPGVAPDGDAVGALLDERIPDERKEEIFGFVGLMEQHHPTEPHWYLPLIGVDPAYQGRGIGSALLRHTLAICDRDGLPAYLEASSERNKALYERHGFEQTAVIQHGSSPPMWPMLRRPR